MLRFIIGRERSKFCASSRW